MGDEWPNEAARSASVHEPVRYVEGGELESAVRIRQQHVDDDPRLLYPGDQRHTDTPLGEAQQTAGPSLDYKLRRQNPVHFVNG